MKVSFEGDLRSFSGFLEEDFCLESLSREERSFEDYSLGFLSREIRL